MVRHGHDPARAIQTGIGPVEVRKPKARDRGASASARIRFTSNILPKWARRTKSLDALLPVYVESRIYNAMLQSAASEHAARQKAMKSATDNAEKLIKNYTRLSNAARQSEITQQISEIVGGADALVDTSDKE